MKKILLLLLFMCSTIVLDAQCAMCRAVLESDPDQSAAEGINNGIIYLMAIPYILVFGIGYVIYRKFKRA